MLIVQGQAFARYNSPIRRRSAMPRLLVESGEIIRLLYSGIRLEHTVKETPNQKPEMQLRPRPSWRLPARSQTKLVAILVAVFLFIRVVRIAIWGSRYALLDTYLLWSLIAVWVVLIAVSVIKPRIRFDQEHCPNCHYDVRGNTPGRCPECGSLIQRRMSAWSRPFIRNSRAALSQADLAQQPERASEANR